MSFTTVRKLFDGSASGSVVFMCIGALMSLIVIGGVIFSRIAVQRMFDEFAIQGSFTTKLALSPYFLLALIVGTAILVVKEFRVSNKQTTLAINLLYCLLVLTALAIYIAGLFLPMMRMTQTV